MISNFAVILSAKRDRQSLQLWLLGLLSGGAAKQAWVSDSLPLCGRQWPLVLQSIQTPCKHKPGLEILGKLAQNAVFYHITHNIPSYIVFYSNNSDKDAFSFGPDPLVARSAVVGFGPHLQVGTHGKEEVRGFCSV